MFELIVVILIVGAAAFYVGRQLLRQLKGRGCENCDCSQQAEKTVTLLQIKPSDEKKP